MALAAQAALNREAAPQTQEDAPTVTWEERFEKAQTWDAMLCEDSATTAGPDPQLLTKAEKTGKLLDEKDPQHQVVIKVADFVCGVPVPPAPAAKLPKSSWGPMGPPMGSHGFRPRGSLGSRKI